MGKTHDMFRRKLIDLLLDRPMSVQQIARAEDEAPKTVAADLQHLIQSLKHGDYSLVVSPAECRKCGFRFGPEKLQKPSKCPLCKSTWLTEPLVEVRRRQEGK
jgi:transcriptional regulator